MRTLSYSEAARLGWELTSKAEVTAIAALFVCSVLFGLLVGGAL